MLLSLPQAADATLAHLLRAVSVCARLDSDGVGLAEILPSDAEKQTKFENGLSLPPGLPSLGPKDRLFVAELALAVLASVMKGNERASIASAAWDGLWKLCRTDGASSQPIEYRASSSVLLTPLRRGRPS